MHIIHEDEFLLIVSKPAGLPVQPDKTGDESLLVQAETLRRQPLGLIHRLDRPASGLVVLAKTTAMLTHLNQQFADRLVKKTYLALVEKKVSPFPTEKVHLVHHLSEGDTKTKAYDKEGSKTRRAELTYQLHKEFDRYAMLEVDLLTGRQHQIRAQLSAAGLVLKGDVKYGARRSNPDRSIGLHAWKISFRHPATLEQLTFEAPLPVESEKLWSLL